LGAFTTLACLLVGGALAIVAISRETEVAKSEHVLATQVQMLARQAAPSPNINPIDNAQPARALLLQAQSRLLQLPYVTNDEDRQRLLVEAERAVDTALLRRPNWGEAQVILAYLRAQHGDRTIVGTCDALAASYRNARYLVNAAEWRVMAGASLWSHLSGETRDRLINEAVWAARLGHDRHRRIFAALRHSAAYVPFLLRWREVRALDADLVPA
jgi:hypothetical protein